MITQKDVVMFGAWHASEKPVWKTIPVPDPPGVFWDYAAKFQLASRLAVF